MPLNIDSNDFTNPNVFCFDLEQYNPYSEKLICTVFVNYKLQMYYKDVNVLSSDHFKWKKDRWIFYQNLNSIICIGIEGVVEHIRDEYKKENK